MLITLEENLMENMELIMQPTKTGYTSRVWGRWCPVLYLIVTR